MSTGKLISTTVPLVSTEVNGVARFVTMPGSAASAECNWTLASGSWSHSAVKSTIPFTTFDGEKDASTPISTCRACALKRQARERCERTLVGGNRSTNEAAGWPRSSWSWLSPKCGVAVWSRARATSMA